MFAGSLIFDPVLKICNWPDSTTCISELLGPTKRVKLPGFVAADQDLSSKVKSVPSPTTELPVIETSTAAIKLSKRILSLFQNKNRKPSRYRTGLPGRRKESESSSEGVLVHLLHPRRILSVPLQRWHLRVISSPISDLGGIILLVNAQTKLDHPVDSLGVDSGILQAEARAE